MSVEMVVLVVPLAILALLFAVACYRLAGARVDVDAAAAAAARDASLARSPAAALARGQAAAATALAGRATTCTALTVEVDVSALRPGGAVAVTVVCTISTADLTGLGLPGTTTATGRARQPVDTFIGSLGFAANALPPVDPGGPAQPRTRPALSTQDFRGAGGGAEPRAATATAT